jgi:hypothetical protein
MKSKGINKKIKKKKLDLYFIELKVKTNFKISTT